MTEERPMSAYWQEQSFEVQQEMLRLATFLSTTTHIADQKAFYRDLLTLVGDGGLICEAMDAFDWDYDDANEDEDVDWKMRRELAKRDQRKRRDRLKELVEKREESEKKSGKVK